MIFFRLGGVEAEEGKVFIKVSIFFCLFVCTFAEYKTITDIHIL